jgi:hypothetical protein
VWYGYPSREENTCYANLPPPPLLASRPPINSSNTPSPLSIPLSLSFHGQGTFSAATLPHTEQEQRTRRPMQLCCFRANNGTPSVAAFDGSHSTASSPFCLFVMLASSSIPPHPGTGTIHGSTVPSSLRRKGWWAVAWTGRGWMVEQENASSVLPFSFFLVSSCAAWVCEAVLLQRGLERRTPTHTRTCSTSSWWWWTQRGRHKVSGMPTKPLLRLIIFAPSHSLPRPPPSQSNRWSYLLVSLRKMVRLAAERMGGKGSGWVGRAGSCGGGQARV